MINNKTVKIEKKLQCSRCSKDILCGTDIESVLCGDCVCKINIEKYPEWIKKKNIKKQIIKIEEIENNGEDDNNDLKNLDGEGKE